MDKYDFILPAGGRIDDHFARVALTPYKPLIKVHDYMVGINRVILVAPKEVQDAYGIRVPNKLNDTGDLSKNITMAIRELKADGGTTAKVIILTTDLPFIEGKHIQKFIEMCRPDADICVPLISKDEYLDRFPSASGTFAKLKDGEYTLGCIYLMNPDTFLKILPQVESVVANRKSLPKMAKLLGGGFVWKYITKSLTTTDVVRKVETILGCRVGLVQGGPAEFAYDIDDLKDYEYALANK